jgi:hypothetical protein
MSQNGDRSLPGAEPGGHRSLANPEVTHIGSPHSDNRLTSTPFDQYLSHLESSRCDFFYSDIGYDDKDDRRVRLWNAGLFSMFKLKTG